MSFWIWPLPQLIAAFCMFVSCRQIDGAVEGFDGKSAERAGANCIPYAFARNRFEKKKVKTCFLERENKAGSVDDACADAQMPFDPARVRDQSCVRMQKCPCFIDSAHGTHILVQVSTEALSFVFKRFCAHTLYVDAKL